MQPDAVEAGVAERRVAAAAQVEVAVPDAVAKLAGPEHGGVQAGARGRGSASARPSCRASRPMPAAVRCRANRVQGRAGVQVIDERPALRAGGLHPAVERRVELPPGRRRVSGRTGQRLLLRGRARREPSLCLWDGGGWARVETGGPASIWASWSLVSLNEPNPARRDRRHRDYANEADGEPVSQALSNSSTVCGPTHATESSSGTPAATSLTSSKVTWSSSAIVRSGSTSSP